MCRSSHWYTWRIHSWRWSCLVRGVHIGFELLFPSSWRVSSLHHCPRVDWTHDGLHIGFVPAFSQIPITFPKWTFWLPFYTTFKTIQVKLVKNWNNTEVYKVRGTCFPSRMFILASLAFNLWVIAWYQYSRALMALLCLLLCFLLLRYSILWTSFHVSTLSTSFAKKMQNKPIYMCQNICNYPW